jgi:hypothetical protein
LRRIPFTAGKIATTSSAHGLMPDYHFIISIFLRISKVQGSSKKIVQTDGFPSGKRLLISHCGSLGATASKVRPFVPKPLTLLAGSLGAG